MFSSSHLKRPFKHLKWKRNLAPDFIICLWVEKDEERNSFVSRYQRENRIKYQNEKKKNHKKKKN